MSIVKGTFIMGSPTSEPCRNSTVEQQHQVTLTHGLELQTTEVTQDQFLAMMGYNPSQQGCGGDCPVETVTWHEAVAYCNALSAKRGYSTCYQCTGAGASVSCTEAAQFSGQKIYTCPGYRLPTEAEWEYAYRAGTTTAYYSGPNDDTKCGSCAALDTNADKIGWYCANSGGITHPAKGKQPNAWGLYDMAGNVWEWCHDWYSTIPAGPAVDPWGGASGSERIVRGDACDEPPYALRAAERDGNAPTYRNAVIGFRCARTN